MTRSLRSVFVCLLPLLPIATPALAQSAETARPFVQMGAEVVLTSRYVWRGMDDKLKLGLTGTMVDEQFWRDANTGAGNVLTFVAAEIPSYKVLDLTGEWKLHDHFSLIGGVNNVTDEIYSSRVRADGSEPAVGRHGYFGIEVSL